MLTLETLKQAKFLTEIDYFDQKSQQKIALILLIIRIDQRR